MITVVGEALVDLIPEDVVPEDAIPEDVVHEDADAGDGTTEGPASGDTGGWPGYEARPGGSPLNVAVGLARLGIRTSFLGRLSTDRFGRLLRRHLTSEGVDCSGAPSGPEPTAIALARVADDGRASYRFLWSGTADRYLSLRELPDRVEGTCLHVGSVGALLPPGAEAVHRLVDREADRMLVSYDPNLRPSVTGDADVEARVDALVSRSHLVKVSDDDLRWLAPDRDPLEIADEWRGEGPTLVAVTRGERGAVALTDTGRVSVPALSVTTRDTVGAGDAFTSGLLAWLDEHGHLTPDTLASLPPAEVRRALRFAAAVAGVTATRRGADPPSRDELPT